MLTSSALLTDRYELTMLQAARHSGKADRPSVFEVFCRSLPGGRRYGVVAGTGRLLERIRDFTALDRELLVPLVVEGELQSQHMGIAGVESARAHHAEVKKALPLQALRLMRGEPGIPTQFI